MKREIHNHFPTLRTKLSVLRQEFVSEENLEEILGVTPLEQHSHIDLGDVISVCFFHNGSLRNSGTVTIWHNKGLAVVRTYSASLAGEWLEAQKLVVSEEREEGWTVRGELVTGQLAMDLDGTAGIYSCGEFYRNHCGA